MFDHQINIKMISEASCNTEQWSDDCWKKNSFAFTAINYILKYFKIEKSYFKL